MSDLAATLAPLLDREPRAGFLGIGRLPPLDEGVRAIGDRWTEARPLLGELVRTHPSETVRYHAAQLWARAHIFDETRGEDRLHDFRRDVLALLPTVSSARVRGVLAAELLRYELADRVAALRAPLAPLRADIAALPDGYDGKEEALRRLDGGTGLVRLLAQLAAGPAPVAVPEDLPVQLLALRVEPVPEAAPLLSQLYVKLPAILDHARRPRVTGTIRGVGELLDPESNAAIAIVSAYLACVPATRAPTALDFLRATPAQLLDHILETLTAEGEKGARVLCAIASYHLFVESVRLTALARLAAMQDEPPPVGALATGLLRWLSTDADVGAAATAAVRA